MLNLSTISGYMKTDKLWKQTWNNKANLIRTNEGVSMRKKINSIIVLALWSKVLCKLGGLEETVKKNPRFFEKSPNGHLKRLEKADSKILKTSKRNVLVLVGKGDLLCGGKKTVNTISVVRQEEGSQLKEVEKENSQKNIKSEIWLHLAAYEQSTRKKN